MKPLFFVDSTFQMYVALQIINAEGCSQIGFILSDKFRFRAAFEMMLKDVTFSYERYYLPELVIYPRALFKCIRNVYTTEKKIRKILDIGKYDCIYMGNHWLRANHFIAERFSQLGNDVNFYEEGTSHYQDSVDNLPAYAKQKKIIAKLLDLSFFKPLYGMKFGERMMELKFKKFDELPFNKRYSILDKYHTDRDVRLKITNLDNKALKEYILNDLPADIEQKKVSLFLSEPLHVGFCGNLRIYLDVIEDAIKSETDTDLFLVKYHPRETEAAKAGIEEIFKRLGKPYQILTANIPLPIELYFEYLSPQKLILFMTSTYLYAPQLAPNTEVVMLIQEYAKRCREQGCSKIDFLEKIMQNLNL